MFNKDVNSSLEKMGFIPNQFYERISQSYVSKEFLFQKLIENFYPLSILKKENFQDFAMENSLEEGDLFNTLYELFNNIRQYKSGGKFGLFKEREAAWGLPSNILNQNDIFDCGDLEELANTVEIFRGMSEEEYNDGDFGQSWSTNYEMARSFAKQIYSDKSQGIVVKAKISKTNVLHYDKNKEFEVIVIKGNPKKSDVEIIG